jgi:hypothetical protein
MKVNEVIEIYTGIRVLGVTPKKGDPTLTGWAPRERTAIKR